MRRCGQERHSNLRGSMINLSYSNFSFCDPFRPRLVFQEDAHVVCLRGHWFLPRRFSKRTRVRIFDPHPSELPGRSRRTRSQAPAFSASRSGPQKGSLHFPNQVQGKYMVKQSLRRCEVDEHISHSLSFQWKRTGGFKQKKSFPQACSMLVGGRACLGMLCKTLTS